MLGVLDLCRGGCLVWHQHDSDTLVRVRSSEYQVKLDFTGYPWHRWRKVTSLPVWLALQRHEVITGVAAQDTLFPFPVDHLTSCSPHVKFCNPYMKRVFVMCSKPGFQIWDHTTADDRRILWSLSYNRNQRDGVWGHPHPSIEPRVCSGPTAPWLKSDYPKLPYFFCSRDTSTSLIHARCDLFSYLVLEVKWLWVT